jgi:hypothetical protein
LGLFSAKDASKEAKPDFLLKAIERVHAGELWLNRQMTAALVTELRRPVETPKPPAESAMIGQLTARERLGVDHPVLFMGLAPGRQVRRDGLVNLVGITMEGTSFVFRRLQTGLIQNYVLLMLIGASSIWLLYESPDAGERVGVGQALYGAFSLMFFQPSLAFPRHPWLEVLYFVIPVVGLGVLADGVLRFGVMLFNKRARKEEWQMSRTKEALRIGFTAMVIALAATPAFARGIELRGAGSTLWRKKSSSVLPS